VKGVDELAPESLDPRGRPLEGASVLLDLPEIRNAVLERLRDEGERSRVFEFDPRQERLCAALRRVFIRPDDVRAVAPPLALVAPFFLLKRDGICTEASLAGDFPGGVSFFSNNYTLQGVKIKRSKPLLNRVFSLLALLSPSELRDCPFVGKLSGIHVVDLSYIPEKYRLDVRRAERILNGSLAYWLDEVRRIWETA